MLARHRVSVVFVFAALIALTGCQAGANEPSAPTLAETKSPVQLLRNEAWDRLPKIVLQTDSETTDISVACQAEGSELMRFWSSSTVALLTNSQSPRVRTVADELSASFIEQGWVESRSESEASTVMELTKTSSLATIVIESTDRADGQRASIRISATGPCVETDGPDSEEVRALEREG